MRIEKRSVSEEVLKISINPKQKTAHRLGTKKSLKALYTQEGRRNNREALKDTNNTEKKNGQLSERSILPRRVPGISRRHALLHNRANL